MKPISRVTGKALQEQMAANQEGDAGAINEQNGAIIFADFLC